MTVERRDSLAALHDLGNGSDRQNVAVHLQGLGSPQLIAVFQGTCPARAGRVRDET